MIKKTALLTFIFFLISFRTFADSKNYILNSNVTLTEIDQLIKKTEYDEALRLLNIYIAANPENFDNAQRRIKNILNQRLQYADLADKLIQMIVNEPENSKEIYEIIAQMEKFERHPSDANLQFIADVKKSAEFNYFRAVFMDIQNQAAELTAKEQYASSMEKIREGFWLYKDDFYEHWEKNPEFIKASEGVLSDLEKNIAQFESRDYVQKISDTVQKFISQVNSDMFKEAELTFTDLQRQFMDLNKLRLKIEKDSRDFAAIFENTKKFGADDTDASYLPFMIHFVDGIASVEKSGLLGTLDGFWDALLSKMNRALFNQVAKAYKNYQPDALSAAPAFQPVINYAGLENKVIALYNIRGGAFLRNGKEISFENPLEEYKILCDYLIKVIRGTEDFKKLKNQLVEFKASQNALIESLGASVSGSEKAVNELFALIEKIEASGGQKSAHMLSTADWALSYNNLASNQWSEISELYSSLVDDVFLQIEALETESWQAVSRSYMRQSDFYVSQARRADEAGKIYFEGFCTKIEEADYSKIKKNRSFAVDYAASYQPSQQDIDTARELGLYFRYPVIAQNIFAYNSENITGYLANLNEIQAFISSSWHKNENWLQNEAISNIVRENDIYLKINKDILLDIQRLSESEIASAKAKSFQATMLKNEGDIRYEEAQAALKKKDYKLARKKLQDALSKYDESLDNQNDEELRAEVDKKLLALGERITREENEFVVVEVRNLKTLAKDAYFNGRFDDAEKYLNQAKSRWADTNVTEDEEITNLMSFVNTAVSMNTGREILPSYPQYPEMSQLLDMSYQYYNSGKEKYEAGNKKEGNADLNKALQSIQKLQYVYPLNQEASILTLKINKLKDPEKFREEFSQKIEAAKFMCKGADTRREGYANLLDYAQIEPDYPGLKNLIYQTEIEIGIRKKPLDNSSGKKARSLYDEAKKMYSEAKSDRKKLEAALAKINQSLALNSDDKDAMKLKDQITTKIGGSAPMVLSTEDERLYQLAIQRLQNNNIAGADAIVTKLLQKSQNMNSQKIKDLKVKIDARS